MSVKLSVNTMSSSLKRIQKKLNNVPKEAYKEFVKVTPVKTGNAKRKTKLKGKTIVADYPYAQVLDKGRHMTSRGMRGSEQAPEGMSKPTTEFIKQTIDKIIKAK
jgi:hypothetical protein